MHSSRWRKFKYAIKEPKKKTSPTHMTRLWCRTWRVWEAAVFARLKNKFGWSQTKTKKQLSKSKIKMKTKPFRIYFAVVFFLLSLSHARRRHQVSCPLFIHMSTHSLKPTSRSLSHCLSCSRYWRVGDIFDKTTATKLHAL